MAHFICMALLFSSLFSPIKATAYLEPTIIENADDNGFSVNSDIIDNEALYHEFYFTSELYVKENNEKGAYYEVDMSCRVAIGADGKIVYVIYAQEDIDNISSEEPYGISMNSPSFTISYELPEWHTSSTSYMPKALSDCSITGEIAEANCITHYNMSCNQNIDFAVSSKAHKATMQFRWGVRNNSFIDLNERHLDYTKLHPSLSFHKGDILGIYVVSPNSMIYTDESGMSFVKNTDGSKNYFHDTINVTIDDVTLAKEIGDSWGDSSALVYKHGDVDANREISVSDVVLFQKYLLGEVKELPCWQAADLYKDDTLDVFDLAMMKRKLIQKG